MDYSPWNSPGQNTGVGSLSLLQQILPTQDRTQVSHIADRFFTSWATGKPKNTGVGSLSLLHWIFLTQKSKQGLLHFRRILYQLSYQGSPNEGLTGIKIKSMPERISQHCLVFYVYFCKLSHNILLILFFVLQLVFFQ